MVTKVLSSPGRLRRNARRVASVRPAPVRRADPSEERALTFLGEILLGESPWRLPDVQRLLALHTLVAIGHWHADGLDLASMEQESS